MRINLKNFLTFKDLTSFDLLPITLLTGRVDSRKESFFKLMRYLKNGWRKLDFGDEESDARSGNNTENYNADLDDLTVQCTSNHSLLPFDMMEEAVYGKSGRLKKRRIFLEEDGRELFNERIELVEISALAPDMAEKTINSPAFVFTMDYRLLADLIYNMELTMDYVEYLEEGEAPGFKYSQKPLKEFFPVVKKEDRLSWPKVLPGYSEKLKLSNYIEKCKAARVDDFMFKDFVCNSVFINEIKAMERDYLLYEVYFDGKNVMDLPEVKAGVLEVQDGVFNYFSMPRFGVSFEDKEFFLDTIKNLAGCIETFVKERFNDYFEEVKSVEVRLTALGRLMLTEKLFTSDNYKGEEDSQYNCSLLEKIVSESFSGLESLSGIEYISLDRRVDEDVLTANATPGQFKDAKEFRKCQARVEKCLNSKLNRWEIITAELLTKSLQFLGLDGELHVEMPVPGAAVIYVIVRGEKLPLTALGNSYSRIVPLLMKLYILRISKAYTPAYVLIEEPEAGLDPETQFLLAEIFNMWRDRTRNWFFILQSNSPALKEGLCEIIRDGELDSEHVVVNHVTMDTEEGFSTVQILKLNGSAGVIPFPTEEGEDITGTLIGISDAQLN